MTAAAVLLAPVALWLVIVTVACIFTSVKACFVPGYLSIPTRYRIDQVRRRDFQALMRKCAVIGRYTRRISICHELQTHLVAKGKYGSKLYRLLGNIIASSQKAIERINNNK